MGTPGLVIPPAAGVRLLLPLRWVPDRLGMVSWVLGEAPTGQGAWVDELARQLELLRDRLAQVCAALRHAKHAQRCVAPVTLYLGFWVLGFTGF